MTIVCFLWGLEYIAAKNALVAFTPITLVFVKFSIGIALVLILKLIIDRRFPLKKADIPLLILCAIFGEVLYYASEYGAMAYLPVSVITIILAFVPSLSLLLELIIYKTRPTLLMIAGVFISIIGVSLVISADFAELLSGKYIGYLLAFGAVISWNVYNFITKRLTDTYKPLDLTLYQLVCAVLISAPIALSNMPELSALDTSVWTGVIYLGCVSGFIGFLIYINAIAVIGPTPCAIFSNFLPVTATLFGWWLLGERISGVQIIGGIIVIFSGVMVIWLKEQNQTADKQGVDLHI